MNRNKVEDSKIEEPVTQLKSSPNEELKLLAEKVSRSLLSGSGKTLIFLASASRTMVYFGSWLPDTKTTWRNNVGHQSGRVPPKQEAED